MYLKSKNSCVTREVKISNCFHLNPTGNSCLECSPSFILNENSDKCTPEISNCLVHEEVLEVLLCKQCQNGYYQSEDKLSCKKGEEALHCEHFKNQTDCFVCQNGFYLDIDNSCKPHLSIDNCQTLSQTKQDQCETCDPGYVNFENSDFCEEITPVANCQVYLTKNQCKKCLDGYELITPKICFLIDPELNCLQMSQENKEHCVLCKHNYYIKEGVCIPIYNFLTTNCEEDNRDGVLGNDEVFRCDHCKVNFYS